MTRGTDDGEALCAASLSRASMRPDVNDGAFQCSHHGVSGRAMALASGGRSSTRDRWQDKGREVRPRTVVVFHMVTGRSRTSRHMGAACKRVAFPVI